MFDGKIATEVAGVLVFAVVWQTMGNPADSNCKNKWGLMACGKFLD